MYVCTYKHTQNKQKKYCGSIYSSLLPLAMKKIYYTSYFTAYDNKNIFTCRNTGAIFLFCP